MKQHFFRSFVVFAGLASLAGLSACVSGPAGPAWQAAEIPADLGRIEIYRSATGNEKDSAPEVSIGETVIGKLPPGGYLALNLTPGNYPVIVRETFVGTPLRKLAESTAAVAAGQTTYLRYERSEVGVRRHRGEEIPVTEIQLSTMNADTALAEISATHAVAADESGTDEPKRDFRQGKRGPPSTQSTR